MTNSSPDEDPPHLRLTEFDSSNRPATAPRQLAGFAGLLAVMLVVACLPIALVPEAAAGRVAAYAWGVGIVLGLDLLLVIGLLFWRTIQFGWLGEHRFTVEAYEGSLPRNMVLGGGMHLMGLMLLWVPLFNAEMPAPFEGDLGPMIPFMVLAGMTTLAAAPWILQFALGICSNTLECHEEGMLIGALFPCRWSKISSYSLWEDDCSMVTFQLKKRGSLEVFMSTDDRAQLVRQLEQVVGPPTSIGGRPLEPDQENGPKADTFSIFR
ncbi:MAG: hypothetical protein WD045_06395 [Pirellulaceae bacterium]